MSDKLKKLADDINLLANYHRLFQELKKANIKIDVAIEGLKTLISQGDMFGIAQKTLDEMEKIKDDSFNDNSENIV